MSGFGSTPAFGTSASTFSFMNPTSGGSGWLPFPTASSTSPFAAAAAPPLFFGHPAPITSAFGTNTTTPGFWPSILGCQSHALVPPSSSGYMLVGLVPVYCPNPCVPTQAAPTVGTQGGNEGVSTGIATGFNPFASSVPPPTTSPWSFSQPQTHNNPFSSTTPSNSMSVIPAGPPIGFLSTNRTEATTGERTFCCLPSTPPTPTPPTEATTRGMPGCFQFPPRTEVTSGWTPTFQFPSRTEATTGRMPCCSPFTPQRETTTGGTLSCFQFPPRTETTTGETPACFSFTPQTETTTGGTPACFQSPPRTETRTCGLLHPSPFQFRPQTETTTGGTPAFFSFPHRTEATTGGNHVSVPFTPHTAATTVANQDPTGGGTKSCECSIFGKTMICSCTQNPFSSHHISSVEARCDEYPSIQRGGGSRSLIFTPTSEEGRLGSFGVIQSMSAMEEFKNKSHEELRLTDYQLGDKGGALPLRSVHLW